MVARKTSKKIRELALLAYERDLSRSIDVLHREMEKWKKGQMTVWDIEQSIHVFHNKTARDLYRRYAQSDSILAVSCGIAHGDIAINDVPEEVREQVQKIAEAIIGGA